jgi:hypothetical protein
MSMPIQVRTTPPGPEDVAAQYGFVTMIAQQIPEIGALMQQAVNENWTADRFSLALAATGWWKSTPDAVRQWTVKQIADPASAERELNTGSDKIRNLTTALGLRLPDINEARGLFLRGQLDGLDETGLQALLARTLLGPAPGQEAGTYGELVNGMYDLAFKYGYSAPDLAQQVHQEARNILQAGGDTSRVGLTGWQGKVQQYAAAKYTPFADRIRGGETVVDIARPYMDSYARVLEQAPSAVKLDDPLLQQALQGDGTAAKPVWAFEQELRKDERWGQTNNAKDAAGKALTSIGRAFGMIG